MGLEWLNEIVTLLTQAGIRAGEAWPGGTWTQITESVAAVGLRKLNRQTGTVEFEIRILTPRKMGGWECQHAAMEAVAVLEKAGLLCRTEPMEYQAGTDCFSLAVVAGWEKCLNVSVAGVAAEYVREFTAEQDRQRRLIGGVNQTRPTGITAGSGGWNIRMVQQLPAGAAVPAEAEEPFVLTVEENGTQTVFSGCGWNRVKRTRTPEQTRLEWEGFALTKEETTVGEAEV